MQHAARDFFIFNPLNPPCQGDFGKSGGLMHQLRKSYNKLKNVKPKRFFNVPVTDGVYYGLF